MVNRPVKRHPGRPPKRRAKRVLTQEQRDELTARLRNRGFEGGDMEVTKAAREKRRARYEAIGERLTTCDIIEFTTIFLKQNFSGYPFQEMLVRCSQGMPLPEGTVKTFVEVPSDGFAVKEVELTWAQYYAMCTPGGACDATGPRPIVTGGQKYAPGKPPSVILCRIGRRGGKSQGVVDIVAFTATRARLRKYVRTSEIVVIPIIATGEEQAQKIIVRLQQVLRDAELEWLIGPMNPDMRVNVAATKDMVPLICGTEVQAFPCNSTKVRGEAAPVVALDEYAHFALEGRKKDKDIRGAATGTQGQFPGEQELLTSTPLAAEGDFYDTEELARSEPSILAFHAPSWTAAPILYRNNPEFYHRKFREDPQQFNIEYRAEYAQSVTPAFREEDIIAGMVLAGELPFDPSHRYGAGVDQSGLSGNDRFSLVICGYDPATDVCYEACCHNHSISDLDLIMADAKETIRRYGVHEVATDRFAKGYVHSAFAKEGIGAVVAPPEADLVVEFRQLLVARKMQLPIRHTVHLGLQQTCMMLTDKSRTPTVWHPRSKAGHADEVAARFRAVHQVMSDNWMRGRRAEDSADRARIEREEAEYDPLTFWRQG